MEFEAFNKTKNQDLGKRGIKIFDFLLQAIPIVWIFSGIILGEISGQQLIVLGILVFYILPYQFLSSIFLLFHQRRKKLSKIALVRLILCVLVFLCVLVCLSGLKLSVVLFPEGIFVMAVPLFFMVTLVERIMEISSFYEVEKFK